MSKKKIVCMIAVIISIFVCYEKQVISKLTHPKVYSEFVDKYSKQFDVDDNLVYSVMKVESKFNKNAISNKGAKGLMQISDITRDWAIEELKLGNIDILEPETNIMIGCWYLDKLYNQFGDFNLMIAAYNGGSGNVSDWLSDSKYSKDGKKLNNIPFEETDNYVKKVSKNYEKYKELYE